MANLVNQHNFIWYGICETDDTSPKDGAGTNESGKCLPFPLADSGIHSAWYVDESGEKKSWSSVSSSNDFTELVCGNSYYVKLNKTDNTIDSVDIPHAVLSEQHYSAETCESTEEPPSPETPFEITDLWIGFAKVDSVAWSFSEFYEARGAESEAYEFVLDAVPGYNQAAGTVNKPKIGTGSGETMTVTQDMIDGIMFMDMFLVNPWTANNKPSIEPLSDLVGATIVKDGETFKILYTANYDYTKFTIIDENFTTESFDFAPLISHVLIVKSTSKPTLSDGDTPSEILETAFNIPNEMSLVCNEEWNYDSDLSYLVFDGNKPHKFTGSYNATTDEAKNSGLKARGDDKSPWLGAKMSMAANGQNTFDSKGGANEALKIKEFYYIKASTSADENPTRIKFGDGTPKGSHC